MDESLGRSGPWRCRWHARRWRQGRLWADAAGQGITISLRDPNTPDVAEWKVDNARWYSTEPNHCNDIAQYEIRAYFEVDHTPGFVSEPNYLTVSADVNCVSGTAETIQYWTGAVAISVEPVDEHWEATVSRGTFDRFVLGDVDISGVDPNSQFWVLVLAEEAFHVGQYDGTTSELCDDLWDPNMVMAEVDANEPFVGDTENDARQAANVAFAIATLREEARSWNIVNGPRRCDIEREAKAYVEANRGNLYNGSFECTYAKKGICSE